MNDTFTLTPPARPLAMVMFLPRRLLGAALVFVSGQERDQVEELVRGVDERPHGRLHSPTDATNSLCSSIGI
jgi:hypothetical protein